MPKAATPAPYDLHLHTLWSYDASARIESHFERAAALGVRCLTITEHHNLDSLPEIAAVSRRYPQIVVLPSAELTVSTSMGDVDLLCYGFPVDLPPPLQEVLGAYRAWQVAMGEAWCRGLQALGYDYTDADRLELLRAYRPPRVIEAQGCTHVRNELQRRHFLERGYIGHAEEYGDLYERAHRAEPFPPYPAVDFVVPAVREHGVVVAIAHPHGYFAQGDRARMDAVRQECGLDGVECAHRGVPADFTPRYRDYCLEHGLLSTGGSDSHTEEDVASGFAGHGGPPEWLDELLERVGHRRLR